MSDFSWQFEAIGTQWQIDLQSKKQVIPQRVKADLTALIEEFDSHYSRFRPDSLVQQINQAAGRYLLPDTAEKLLNFYQKLYRLSNGKVTPLIGQLLVDAGYDATYSLRERTLQPVLPWSVFRYQTPYLEASQPILLDFGAAGKGYLLDLLAQYLLAAGYEDFTLDAGRDLYHHSLQGNLLVGLEHPDNDQQVIGTIRLSNASLCASAGNRRRWGHFHHLIDPDSRRSPKGILASWVLAEEGLVADGLATALFFAPATNFAADFTFEYLVLKSDWRVEKSQGFQAELFLTN